MRVSDPLLDVLETLLEARNYELHGWAITKATRRASPTVYKILERLTEHGMVTARWEQQHPTDDKPRRRFYQLTGHGATTATTLLADRRPRYTRVTHPRPALGQGGA